MASFSGNGAAVQCRCRHPRIILSFLQPLWTSEPPGRKANMDRNHTVVNPNPNPANAQAHAQRYVACMCVRACMCMCVCVSQVAGIGK